MIVGQRNNDFVIGDERLPVESLSVYIQQYPEGGSVLQLALQLYGSLVYGYQSLDKRKSDAPSLVVGIVSLFGLIELLKDFFLFFLSNPFPLFR